MKDKIIKYLRENLLTIGLVFIFVLFHTLVEKYVSKIIVTPVLSNVNGEPLNDIIFIVLLLIIGINFHLKNKKNYKVTLKTLLQNSAILFTYAFYRFFSDLWCFTEFSFIEFIKYLDIIALYFLGNILLFIFYKTKKNNTVSNKGFHLDTSLGKDRSDLLNRESLARYVSSEIKETDSPDSSFAIGISSEWGNGKTSFLDLLERHLDKDKSIVIKINPWINHESKSIVKDFFNSLSSKLWLNRQNLGCF